MTSTIAEGHIATSGATAHGADARRVTHDAKRET